MSNGNGFLRTSTNLCYYYAQKYWR